MNADRLAFADLLEAYDTARLDRWCADMTGTQATVRDTQNQVVAARAALVAFVENLMPQAVAA